jgi:NTP pyrophosphatase (non-canonical NTP hydrolase)
MIAHVRIFGIGFGQDLPPLTSGLLFAPEGIARTVLAARGIRARTELPERFGADDLMLLPGGPEVDDPWLHTGLGQGAEVRFGRPLVLELGLPQASVSRHASRRDAWPAGQGVLVYGDGDPGLPDALLTLSRGVLIGDGRRREGPLAEIAGLRAPGDVLYVPPFGGDTALPFAAAAAVMAILRAPDGCPWDREQTHLSLLPYLLEEAAEAYDALSDADLHGIVEELGDLLLQVLFHGELGREEGTFTLADITDGLWRKLVRRHPHVFGDEHYASAQDFLPRWEQLKAEEGTRRQSELDGIPASLSSLAALEKAMRKLMRCGIREFGESGYTALFEGRVAAGEDLELEARRSLSALKARCRRAEGLLGQRLSAAGSEKVSQAWKIAQSAQVTGEESRNGWPIDES